MALQGIDGVDWASVQHAYGPATDVPTWLEMLASDDKKARAKAVSKLSNAVNHQGSITPAAIPTVPFLVRLFDAGVEHGPLAIMLGDMSVGGFHGNYVMGGFDPASVPEDWGPMRAAVLEAHPRFVAMLADDDAALRSAATIPIAALSECRPRRSRTSCATSSSRGPFPTRWHRGGQQTGKATTLPWPWPLRTTRSSRTQRVSSNDRDSTPS